MNVIETLNRKRASLIKRLSTGDTGTTSQIAAIDEALGMAYIDQAERERIEAERVEAERLAELARLEAERVAALAVARDAERVAGEAYFKAAQARFALEKRNDNRLLDVERACVDMLDILSTIEKPIPPIDYRLPLDMRIAWDGDIMGRLLRSWGHDQPTHDALVLDNLQQWAVARISNHYATRFTVDYNPARHALARAVQRLPSTVSRLSMVENMRKGDLDALNTPAPVLNRVVSDIDAWFEAHKDNA